MKTKDFIKMLQEEDPSGEGYIRIPDGAIYYVEAKEGYWDGSYQFYDPLTKKLHTTIEGYKVDVITINVEDIIWNEEGNMEKIRERLVVNYEGYANPQQKQEKYDKFWKHVEEEATEARKNHNEIRQHFIESVLEKYKNGWKCRFLDGDDPFKLKEQKNKTLSFPLHWKKGLMTDQLCYGEMRVFRDSEGLFTQIKKGKYIYFIKN